MDEQEITEYTVYDFVRAFLAYCSKNLVKSLPHPQDTLWHLFLYEMREKFSPKLPLLTAIIGNFISDTSAEESIININFRLRKKVCEAFLFETGWREFGKELRIYPPRIAILKTLNLVKTQNIAKAEKLMKELGSITVTDEFTGLETDLMELIFRHAKRADGLTGFVTTTDEACSCK